MQITDPLFLPGPEKGALHPPGELPPGKNLLYTMEYTIPNKRGTSMGDIAFWWKLCYDIEKLWEETL